MNRFISSRVSGGPVAEPWHSFSVEQAYDREGSSPLGLQGDEAAHRLERHGPNELVQTARVSPLRLFLGQFVEPLVIILLVAAVVSAAVAVVRGTTEEYLDVAVILVVVILNAILGFVQEYRAERAIQALKAMAAPQAHVVREGRTLTVPARELVPGDLVLLSTGDRVPADLRVTEVATLRINEAALTGESSAVSKGTDALRGEVFLADRRNLAYMGTIVETGRGKGLVVATGMRTELGSIAKSVQEEEAGETPLQKQLERLGKQLGVAIVGICAVIFAVGYVQAGGDVDRIVETFLTAVSLAVAAIPEGLPAIVTITLAIGLQRMAKRHALIRRLPAAEALGSATVICSDKTGTLTKGEMNVREVFVGGHRYTVEGEGFDPAGRVLRGGRAVAASADEDLRLALECALLCNDAALKRGEKGWEVQGDSTEGALLVLAGRAGIDAGAMEAAHPRVAEIPFSSERKMMTTVHAPLTKDLLDGLRAMTDEQREILVTQLADKTALVKGAPDVVIPRCTHQRLDGNVVPLDAATREGLLQENLKMAGKALRVLALALRRLPSEIPAVDSETVERDLVFLGLVGMMDAPRRDALEAVRLCKAAGIKVVMITGDHKHTAMAIANEMGILATADQALTGAELDRLTEADLAKQVERVSVYARVSPEHKTKIVAALKARGHVVAMTGDGVNDAPALKKSDLGVAMGITGTDVAKESADIILTDDNFASIVGAVEEGRWIYDNIRKFVRYMLSTNSGEVLTVFLGSLIFLQSPLAPLQILWINLITDGFPALALAVEPKEKGLMKRKPRDPKAGILSGGLYFHIAWVGTLMMVGGLAVYSWALVNKPWDVDRVEAHTLVFYTISMFQVFHVLAIRVERDSVFKEGFFRNRYLIAAVLLTVFLQLLVIYAGPLQAAFETIALPLEELAGATLIASSVFFAVELEKWVRRRREK